MTATTIRVQMAQRKDTAANWTAANPILLLGEIGYETDTKKFKIGDGTTNWNSLAYLPIPDGSGNLTITGNLEIGSTGALTFEGSTADGFETTLAVTDPTADRTITLPNVTGTVITSGDTGSVTSTMLADGTIVNADINAAAEIAVSKLANGTANQVLVTDGTDVSWSDNLTLAGDLTVNGTTTTINTQDLLVEDKNIIIGNVNTPTDVTADGGGITLKGSTDKTINWVDATDAWTLSENVNIASGKVYRINGTKVLDATSLGSAIVSSSLTSVGTIGTGVWQGTAIDAAYLDSTIVTTGDTGTITSTMIADGTIVNADVNASAAIAGTKISPDFGSQNVTTTGTATAAALIPSGSSVPTNGVYLPSSNNVAISSSGSERIRIGANGEIGLSGANYGTSGQVLTSAGSGAAPTWSTVAGGGASVTTSDSAPVSPSDGDLWYDSVGGRLYVYYDDGNTSQWVDAAPQGGSATDKIEEGNTSAEVIDTGSDGRFVVTTEGTERMRITSDAYVRLASGTGGIQFNGDTAATNALDDYEEGTFTPVVEGTTTPGSVSYGATRVGKYTKIGNMVTVYCAVAWSGGTGTGNLRVAGLPFTSNENYVTAMGATSGLSLTDQYAYGYTLSSNVINIGVTSTNGTSTASSYAYDAAGSMWITLTYFIA